MSHLPRRRWLFFRYNNLNNKLLVAPFVRYLCSVSSIRSFLKSFRARLTVDWDIFKSFEIVAIDGQHSFFSLARSYKYRYTRTARLGNSERYTCFNLPIFHRLCYSSMFCYVVYWYNTQLCLIFSIFMLCHIVFVCIVLIRFMMQPFRMEFSNNSIHQLFS